MVAGLCRILWSILSHHQLETCLPHPQLYMNVHLITPARGIPPLLSSDSSFQLATFRDPRRAAAASTYFWVERHAKSVAVYAPERVNLNRTLD